MRTTSPIIFAALLLAPPFNSTSFSQQRSFPVEVQVAFRNAINHNTAILNGHTDMVESTAFSPDGKHIVSASFDRTIMIWEFPPLQELIDQTRERFKDRPLTAEERKMYYLE